MLLHATKGSFFKLRDLGPVALDCLQKPLELLFALHFATKSFKRAMPRSATSFVTFIERIRFFSSL